MNIQLTWKILSIDTNTDLDIDLGYLTNTVNGYDKNCKNSYKKCQNRKSQQIITI